MSSHQSDDHLILGRPENRRLVIDEDEDELLVVDED